MPKRTIRAKSDLIRKPAESKKLADSSIGSRPAQAHESIPPGHKPVRSVDEIAVRAPRVLLLRAQQAAFYALLIYAALVTAPLTFDVPDIGLDPSWRFAANVLPASQYKYGPDIVFTYGPLGFIEYPQHFGANLPIALLIRIFIWGLLIAQLAFAFRRPRFARSGCFIAIAGIVCAHQFLAGYIDYMLAGTALLLILSQPPEEERFWRGTVPLTILAAVAFLAKESSYVLLLVSLWAYFSLWHLRNHSKPSGRSWLRLATIYGTPFVAYLVYNPSVGGLWAYITGVSQIAGGYSVAMSGDGLPDGEYLRLGVLTTLLIGFAACAVYRKWLNLETAACVLAAFYFAMKHSVVGNGTIISFVYAFSMVLMGFLVLHCRPAKGALLTGGLAFLAVCILSLTEMNPVWKTLDAATWSPTPHMEEIAKVIHWRDSMAALDAQAEANLRADQLPDSLRERIQRAPVIIFPWELAYAPANRLNLYPLYTLQAYAAYSHELDLRTAAHLGNSPPNTRLLMEWKSIEERHPLLDVPATWQAIYTGFAPETAEPNLLLLKKRERPAEFRSRTLASRVADIRQWQEVPDRDYAVSASIRFSQTMLGFWRQTLYKINPIYMEIEPDRGGPQRFRAIPDVLQHEFVINCLPLSSAALESILFEGQCPQKVKRFRFSGDGLASFSAAARITLTESPEERFQFAAREDAGWKETRIPAAVQPIGAGSLDSINGAPVPGSNTAASPVRVSFGSRVELQGWASSGGKTGEAFDAVYLVLGNRQLRAIATIRPDVAQYYQNPKLSKSGFQISIDTLTLERGIYLLTLIGVTHENMYYRCPGQVYLRIE